MKKKISTILVVILLCSVSGATVALAANSGEESIIEKWMPDIIPVPSIYPSPRYPDIKIAKGVAVNKYNIEEIEPVIFLIMNYQGKISTYLFINGRIYEMKEIERSGSWTTGTKVFKYRAHDGSIMTVVIQHFDSYYTVSIVADFKDYLINFEPIYKDGNRLASGGSGIAETIETPIYEEVVKKIKQAPGINIEDIFSKPTGQITEWVE